MSNKSKCVGKRFKERNGAFGQFECGRTATTAVETKVGMTIHSLCCDDHECFNFITSGYPATTRPL